MAGRQGLAAEAKAAAFDRFGLQVTPANVLGVYGVIMEEVTQLTASVQAFQTGNLEGMPDLGSDPVSRPAARGFNETTSQLLAKCRADIDDLRSLGSGLAEAARAYGKTEEQVKAAFDPRNFHYQPEPVQAAVDELPPPLRRLVDPGPAQPPPAGSLRDVLGAGPQ